MNSAVKFLFAVAAGCTLSGCSTPVYVQSDESVNLAKYKSYMWVQTRANQDDNTNVTAFAEKSIRQAVSDQLAKQGWTEVTSNPDVLISYDILVEKSTQQQSEAVYTQPFSRVYYNPYLRRWGTVYYPSRFIGYDYYEVPVKEGTLTITMMDAATDQTVWQAWTTERVDNQKFTSTEITRSVRNIFRKFNP